MASPLTDPLDAAVIFTGRGGSGTRLLSQLADAAGIFIGNHRNKSDDSIEWVDLIYDIAVAAGGGHELPAGNAYRSEIRAVAAAILRRAGPRNSPLWGLKLPEAMLVLPLLIDAFPRAKVVHLTRHPVSSSLRRTHMTSRMSNPVGAVALPAAYRYSRRDPALIAADEPYLHNACSWNFQVRRVVQYGRGALGGDRYLEIAYENTCAEPLRVAAAVRAFLGCSIAEREMTIPVDRTRSSDWNASDPRVDMIWRLCGETAALLGYARAPGASAQERE
jgi:sulfotransferase family protein